MTRETILTAFREQGCHAHQAEFAADFLRADSPPHHLLVSPDGLGKVFTCCLIARYMVEHGRARRLLVVAPSAVAVMWRSRLEGLSKTLPVALVHARAYRQLKANAPDGPPWPGAIAAIVPADAAKNPAIRADLAAVRWDLVIDVASHLHPQWEPVGLLRHMYSEDAAARSLLISPVPWTTPQGQLQPVQGKSPPPCPEYRVTEWLGILPDWDGKRVAPAPLTWKKVRYRRSREEVAFLDLLKQAAGELRASGSPLSFQTEVLVRRAASSPSAAEQTLEIVSKKLSQVRTTRRLATVPEEKYAEAYETADVPWVGVTPQARRSYLRFLESAKSALGEVAADAKLACLLRLLEEISAEKAGRICVLAAYADTVSYLHRAVLAASSTAALTTRGLRYSERQGAIRDFLHDGEILLSTAGALAEEIDLGRVRHVVHYDLPVSAAKMAQIEGRFRQVDRPNWCTMYALEDQSGATDGEAASCGTAPG